MILIYNIFNFFNFCLNLFYYPRFYISFLIIKKTCVQYVYFNINVSNNYFKFWAKQNIISSFHIDVCFDDCYLLTRFWEECLFWLITCDKKTIIQDISENCKYLWSFFFLSFRRFSNTTKTIVWQIFEYCSCTLITSNFKFQTSLNHRLTIQLFFLCWRFSIVNYIVLLICIIILRLWYLNTIFFEFETTK